METGDITLVGIGVAVIAVLIALYFGLRAETRAFRAELREQVTELREQIAELREQGERLSQRISDAEREQVRLGSDQRYFVGRAKAAVSYSSPVLTFP